jgi:hypothetical protein
MSTPASLSEYDALVAKVDAFLHDATQRRDEDIVCGRGCEACCHVSLAVCAVEAAGVTRALRELPVEALRRLAARAQHALAESPDDKRCVMLENDGSCAVYQARPLVCRTQGLALRYPPRSFPDEFVMAHGDDGSDIVWCPLNFTAQPPRGEDVVEAGRLDEMLGVVNLRFVDGDRDAALARHPLIDVVLRFS